MIWTQSRHVRVVVIRGCNEVPPPPPRPVKNNLQKMVTDRDSLYFMFLAQKFLEPLVCRERSVVEESATKPGTIVLKEEVYCCEKPSVPNALRYPDIKIPAIFFLFVDSNTHEPAVGSNISHRNCVLRMKNYKLRIPQVSCISMREHLPVMVSGF